MVDRMPSPRGDRNVRIELGRARLPWEQVAKLGLGSVVSLESLIDEPVDIVVGGQVVARGDVLVLDGCFCIRVTQLLPGREAS
jgi:flagellar motor switch protein FliN/FliY